jgi:hypothetical protein
MEDHSGVVEGISALETAEELVFGRGYAPGWQVWRK